MDINEIIDEEGQTPAPENKPKPKKRININKKALIIIIPLALLLISAGAYFFLYKSKSKGSSVITGPGGKVIFSQVSPELKISGAHQFVNNITVKPKNKPANLLLGTPAHTKVKKSSGIAVTRVKDKKAVKAKKSNNALNDLFTVKYKHKSKKTNIPAVSTAPNMPQNYNVPPIPFNQSLPNFNLKNMAAKVKNMPNISGGNSFNVTGYSGGYVVAQCNKNTKYLKAGESACGYTLLKANANDATFSHNGKFKKISY
jgi:hypothetical protein